MLVNNVIIPVSPLGRFSSFEKRAYAYRSPKHSASAGFDDVLKRVIRTGKPL